MPTLEKVELVGKGFCADVYAWGAGRVLKLFHSVTERAEREFTATKAVHSSGLPVPAAYEIVEVEGRTGIVFERIDGVSLFDRTQARPWSVFSTIRLAAELHATFNRIQAPEGLPSLHERIAARIESSAAPAAEKQVARDRLAMLPDGTTLCHGDYHPGNVLISRRGPVVIDWSSASRGHHIGDVACTCHLMRTASLPPWAAWYSHLMLRGLRSTMQRLYLKWYFRRLPGSTRDVEEWQKAMSLVVTARKVV
jgi:aminoglycoside phosphotransferase (APT) family kinase protein